MRYAYLAFACSAVCALIPDAAMAQCDQGHTCTRFRGRDGGDEGEWDEAADWSFGVPTASLRAWIPDGKTCHFPNDHQSDYHGVAASLQIEEGGTLKIAAQAEEGVVNTLTISESSRIDGELVIEGEDQLVKQYREFGGATFLTGSGTITLDGGPKFQADHNTTEPGSIVIGYGMTVHGVGIMEGEFHNEGLVWADSCATGPIPGFEGTLNLTVGPFGGVNGTGRYVADGGILAIEGSLISNSTSSLELLSECTGAEPELILTADSWFSGPVILRDGEFKLDANLCTEGNLDWSPSADTTHILVTSSHTGRFGASDCTSFP